MLLCENDCTENRVENARNRGFEGIPDRSFEICRKTRESEEERSGSVFAKRDLEWAHKLAPFGQHFLEIDLHNDKSVIAREYF